MTATLVIETAATLSDSQIRALAEACRGLSRRWTVSAEKVSADDDSSAFSLRLVNGQFTAMALFRSDTQPDDLALFLEQTRRERDRGS